MVETGSVDPSVECVQTSQEDEISVLPDDTVLDDAPGLLSETSPVDLRKCVVAVNDSVVFPDRDAIQLPGAAAASRAAIG